MDSFNLHNPTKLIFGENRLSELDSLIACDAKVLITYGGGSAKKYGTLEKVKSFLGDREIYEFGGIEANPEYETLIKAVSVIKEKEINFLLAVGGGSVMDGTKFIAMASVMDCEPQELLFCGFEGPKNPKALPLGCVVTLPATGSEMNRGAVITYKEQKYTLLSEAVYPQFSFSDPLLTKTLPKEQIANGIVDAFIHITEQYLTFPVGAKVQDSFSEGLMRTLIEEGPKTYADNEDMLARKNFIFSATMALNGLIGVGVPQDWTTHMIGHELTSLFGIAHGRTLAIILPSLLRYRKEQKKEKLLQFAQNVWGIKSRQNNLDLSDEEIVDLGISKMQKFFESLDIVVSLSHYGIKKEDIQKIVSNMESMGLKNLSERGDFSLDDVAKVLGMAL